MMSLLGENLILGLLLGFGGISLHTRLKNRKTLLHHLNTSVEIIGGTTHHYRGLVSPFNGSGRTERPCDWKCHPNY